MQMYYEAKMTKLLIILGLIGCHQLKIEALTCPQQCHCSFKRIQCSYTKIKLSEIKRILCPYASEITELHLMGNKLNDSSVRYLTCFTKLEVLQLSYNLLTRFPDYLLKNLPSLRTLYLTSNKISILPDFLPISKLEILFLDNNQISDIPETFFRESTKLRELYLNKNKITRLKESLFKGMSLLEKIYLNNNNIVAINSSTFQPCSKLTEIYLQFNKLTEITNDIFKNNVQLRKIFLHENRLHKLKSTLFDGLHLEKLYLYSNNFTELDNDLFYRTEIINEFYIHENPFHCTCPLIKFKNRYEESFLNNGERVAWGYCQNFRTNSENKIKELKQETLNCNACEVAFCKNNTTCIEVNNTKDNAQGVYECIDNIGVGNIVITTTSPVKLTDKIIIISKEKSTNEPFDDVIIIVSVVAALGLIIFAAIAVFLLHRTRKQKFSLDEGESVVASVTDLSVSGSIKLESLKRKRPSLYNTSNGLNVSMDESHLMIPKIAT